MPSFIEKIGAPGRIHFAGPSTSSSARVRMGLIENGWPVEFNLARLAGFEPATYGLEVPFIRKFKEK